MGIRVATVAMLAGCTTSSGLPSYLVAGTRFDAVFRDVRDDLSPVTNASSDAPSILEIVAHDGALLSVAANAVGEANLAYDDRSGLDVELTLRVGTPTRFSFGSCYDVIDGVGFRVSALFGVDSHTSYGAGLYPMTITNGVVDVASGDAYSVEIDPTPGATSLTMATQLGTASPTNVVTHAASVVDRVGLDAFGPGGGRQMIVLGSTSALATAGSRTKRTLGDALLICATVRARVTSTTNCGGGTLIDPVTLETSTTIITTTGEFQMLRKTFDCTVTVEVLDPPFSSIAPATIVVSGIQQDTGGGHGGGFPD